MSTHKLKAKSYKLNLGQLSLQVLIVGFIGIIVLSGFVVWADSHIRSVERGEKRALAFAISESGIEYYRWHLAHSPTDYQDGTGAEGPYTHDYFDKDGDKIGEFELDITPPEEGGNIVIIRSTGRLEADPGVEKIIQATLAYPSLARFAVAANDDMRFGEGTQTYGQIHSNGGIRFDGIAYNLVSSAKEDYNDPDHSGGNEFGVHTHVYPIDPQPPAEIPVRLDVFTAGREVGVPALDFTGFTQDLSEIKALAISSDGFYQEESSKRDYGYHVVLKTNGTFDLYVVDALVSPPRNCPASQTNWGTWSIVQEHLVDNYDYPNNGIIFIEDDIWVDGQIDGEKLTITAGRFPDVPSKRKSITVNNDLLYTNYDGSDSLALIAQENFNVGLKSEDDLRIDGAIIAQNGRIGRFYNSSRCGDEYIRDTITLFGMLASNERYGFAYTDGTGYQNRIIIYDGNLLYSPPPKFPSTAEQYQVLSWEEIK
ncbi:MAG: hypothetical protein COU09_01050 [Candidatus Harrisonbacteria bacterium CG10_big_fil_rev_8_21_14_0_10_44_23]|uniref:Type 4 fimbrial biogenesis protein PilX N-terminal domain-containing protein n=1 Tax=Candidatus Harrisonbacteria bacterium CG10_big_fil_rev_8_21_14_0_10_44_23 TaxID=1974585 RepID=A0A2H0UQD9_9BACT|nr:MAG: hypothetical protein COU09_01050 [Candidatus Harrisonbacteria bacterium CG10_big_fil_rev_8_21_14_0_10_44_23]